VVKDKGAEKTAWNKERWGKGMKKRIVRKHLRNKIPGYGSNYYMCSGMLSSVHPLIPVLYTVSEKVSLFFAITLPNPNRSSKFFYHRTQQ